MNKRIKLSAITTFIFTVAFFLIPQQAHGFVLDLAQTQLSALSERTGPVAAVFFSAFLFFSLGYILLYLAASLLQGIIAITPVVLSVTAGGASDFVRIGWSFTAGIVNLIMIIAFIVIAFAVILGSEKIQLKKALPRLIVVALFVNFTLLFVGVGIDASNFLFNTVANQFLAETAGGGNVFFDSLTPLFELSQGQILATTLYLTGSAMGLLIPYVNVLMQVAWVVGIPWLFSTVVQFIVYGAIMWGMASLFLLYFFVFVIRIFIIQVLAVLAPLAFFCLIFDETKKYWDQWLSHLVQWLFVGVIFIFLMYFGLAMAPIVMTMADPFANLFFPGATPDDLGWFAREFMSILGYIILLAYFTVIIFIAKKFVPAAAGAVISQATGAVKSMTPWVGAIGKGAATRLRNKELERSEKIKERESKGEDAGLGSRLRTGAMKAQSWAVRRGHNVTGTSVKQGIKKDVESKVEAMKKRHGDDYKDFAQYFDLIKETKTITDKMAALQYLEPGGAKAINNLKPEDVADYLELASKRGDSKTVKNIVRHIPNHADTDKYSEELKLIKERIKKENPDASGEVLEDLLERDKEGGAIKKKLAIATKMQGAMMSDIEKEDPEIEKLKGRMKIAQASLSTAVTKETREKIGKEIENMASEINKATTMAMNKIAVKSLKVKDIENLAPDTVNNRSFLRAVAENKSMNFIQPLGERPDGGKVMEELMNVIIKDIGIKNLKDNKMLYNQIKNSPAAQAILSDIHEEIVKSESQKGKSGSEDKKDANATE